MKHQIKRILNIATTTVPGFIAAIVLSSLGSSAAYAQQQAYTNKSVNLRAGPSTDYPIVIRLPTGAGVIVMGCIDNYHWCDVSVGDNRGWLYAGNIIYAYQGNHVPVLTYGTVIGIGITPFVFGSYWDNYYTNYPWYPQRQYWSNRPYNQPHYVRPAVVHRAPVANVQPVRPPSTAPVQVRPVRPAPAARAPQVRAPQQQRSVAPPNTSRSAPSAHVSPVRP